MTVKGFLMWNISALRDGGSTYPYGHLRSIPTHHPFPLRECVSAVLLSVSDFFVQKYLVQYQLLLWRSLQFCHYLANKETKVQLRINEHEDAFKHIRWTSSITVFSFSSLFFWQAITSVQSWSLRHVTITLYSHLMYKYYAIHHSFILFQTLI